MIYQIKHAIHGINSPQRLYPEGTLCHVVHPSAGTTSVPTHPWPVGTPVLSGISTPLITTVWESELAHHPSPTFAHYIVNGIRQGFRIGCSRQLQLTSASTNMASALEHPEVVSEYLRQELLLNRMVIIPRSHLPLIQGHISPFGVIPKRAISQESGA